MPEPARAAARRAKAALSGSAGFICFRISSIVSSAGRPLNLRVIAAVAASEKAEMTALPSLVLVCQLRRVDPNSAGCD